MGHPGSVSRMLSAGRADKNPAMKRNALTQTLFPDEQSAPMNHLDVNARGPTRMRSFNLNPVIDARPR